MKEKTMKGINQFLIVIVTFGIVSCVNPRYGEISSKSARQTIQKLATAVMGCKALMPDSFNVTCTIKTLQQTKKVNCSSKVPVGTSAGFTCHDNYKLKDPSYNTIKCKLPGKWDKTVPSCILTNPASMLMIDPLDPPTETTTTTTTTTTLDPFA